MPRMPAHPTTWRRWRSLCALLALGACDPPPSDVQTYLAATAQPLNPAACLPLQDADLRGECVGLSAYNLARVRRMDEALAACRGLEEGKWRSECFFLVADGRGVRGREAHHTCTMAGSYRAQCLGHAMQRETHPELARMRSGNEAATLAAMTRIGERYLGPDEGPLRARQLMQSALAERDPKAPFGPTTCGDVDPDLCLAAYEERVRHAAAWRKKQVGCERPPTLQEATDAGLPTWEPLWEDQAKTAWERLCQDPQLPSP
jgi:hypothetical protein